MELSSTSITPYTAIHLKYCERGAGGQNVSPALSWSGAPAGTRSYAVTVFDPDAPTGSGWWHWIAYDIPADVTDLAEGGPLPDGTRQALNDYGYRGYGGACPPPGPPHRYVHTVYALDVDKLDADENGSHASVRFALMANVLDQASLTATFQNKASR